MSQVNLNLHPGPQIEAFKSPAQEILYGGAAGGGKSHLMRVKHLAAALTCPGYRGFIYRLTSDELHMNHLEGPTSMPQLAKPWLDTGFCTYHVQKMTFTFHHQDAPSVIRFRHMGDSKRLGQAQGPDIHGLSLDEASHFDEATARWLRGRMRAAGVIVPDDCIWKFPWALHGSNPGGVGHQWLKSWFIDPKPPMEIWQTPDEEGGLTRQFIPAKLEDNPSIDPVAYEKALSGLGTPELVRAMRDGDWDVAVGARFAHAWSDRVMLKPFEIPKTWRLSRSFDWGSSKPFSYGLWATSNGEQPLNDYTPYIPAGSKIRVAEWYGWDGQPDKGIRMPAKEVAQRIKMLETKLGYWGRVRPGGADPSIWAKDRDQRSVSDDMSEVGVVFRPAPKYAGSRIAGWRVLDDMLAATRDGDLDKPHIYAFEDCRQFRRLIPTVPADRHSPEDVDTGSEDHLADEVRYEVASKGHGSRLIKVGGV